MVLSARQVTSAPDIEAAIHQATNHGTRPRTVILDGSQGPFVLTGDDRSINIFVSNLTLRGINGAVIRDCHDGLFFDDGPADHVRIEGIAFLCLYNGIVSSTAHRDVILLDNLIQAGGVGLGVSHAEGWLVTGNAIRAGDDAVVLGQAADSIVGGNQLNGFIGVKLEGSAGCQVRGNAIVATWQGVLLMRGAEANQVMGNTVLGVEEAGITFEPGTAVNTVQGNRVLCAAGKSCRTVDAGEDVLTYNTIIGNKP